MGITANSRTPFGVFFKRYFLFKFDIDLFLWLLTASLAPLLRLETNVFPFLPVALFTLISILVTSRAAYLFDERLLDNTVSNSLQCVLPTEIGETNSLVVGKIKHSLPHLYWGTD